MPYNSQRQQSEIKCFCNGKNNNPPQKKHKATTNNAIKTMKIAEIEQPEAKIKHSKNHAI